MRDGRGRRRIVFQLVECRQLSARPEDTIADFVGGRDLLLRLAEVQDFGRRGEAGKRPD
ncbi:MAG: hypothetical protein IPJ04_11090 [Candidatus Eisenbacteria bacterium]|nr:hypothetical protein [Candidatus Eisenbacteria bacterium]